MLSIHSYLMYKISITQFNFKDFKEKIYEKNPFTLSLSRFIAFKR